MLWAVRISEGDLSKKKVSNRDTFTRALKCMEELCLASQLLEARLLRACINISKTTRRVSYLCLICSDNGRCTENLNQELQDSKVDTAAGVWARQGLSTSEPQLLASVGGSLCIFNLRLIR